MALNGLLHVVLTCP